MSAGPRVVDRPFLEPGEATERDRAPDPRGSDVRQRAGFPGTQSAGPQDNARLLLIDDDEKRAHIVKTALEQQGFAVRCVADAPAGLVLVSAQMPDLLLVNAILPRVPGIDVCRHLRRAGSDVPIIVLSPRSEEIDVVVAMEMGADDFIAEPYGMRELVARVRAVLRRSSRSAKSHNERPPVDPRSSEPTPSGETDARHGLSQHGLARRAVAERYGTSSSGRRNEGGEAGPDILDVGDITLDRARHEVLLRGEAIDLPRREFMLLEALLEKPGRLLTRHVLMERIWGPAFLGSGKLLSTLVGRLRALIEVNPDDPQRIVTIRGIGYRYEDTNEANN